MNTTCKNIEIEKVHTCTAKSLDKETRKKIAILSYTKSCKITYLSDVYKVSRKFIYAQVNKIQVKIDEAFDEEVKEKVHKVHAVIEITAEWIQNCIINLVLNCCTSYRNIKDYLLEVCNYSISIGSIKNCVQEFCNRAIAINQREDLSQIKVGCHDEMFQGGKPILGGIDPKSFYCYLLQDSEKRDEAHWGVNLLDCTDKGFSPEYTIADFGTGLRAGQAAALPGVECFGDVFHALQDTKKVLRQMEHAAYKAIGEYEELLKKMQKAQKTSQGRKYSYALSQAYKAEKAAIECYDNMAILMEWLRNDIFKPSGLSHRDRSDLYDFITSNMEHIDLLEQHKTGHKLLTYLKNHKEKLLMFSKLIDNIAIDVSKKYEIPIGDIRNSISLYYADKKSSSYLKLKEMVQQNLNNAYTDTIEPILHKKLSYVFRASSSIENLNGRVRVYANLRRSLGQDFLELLRFYFNHKIIKRSKKQERQGKSPALLLSGNEHEHWLDMLNAVA